MSSQEPFDAVLVLGPVLIGALLDWGLYGALLSQYAWYLYSAPKDKLAIRVLVGTMVFCDSLQTIATTAFSWRVMISGWGNDAASQSPDWSIVAIPILTAIISVGVQMFFSWRVMTLSKWRVIAGLLMLVTLIQGACGLVVGIEFAKAGSLEGIYKLYPYVITWLGGSALCDVLTAVTLVYFCYRAREAIGHRASTSTTLMRISFLAVETGCLTSALSLTDLSLALAFRNSNVHLSACFLMTKSYTNALLLALNIRPLLSKRTETALHVYAVQTLPSRSPSFPKSTLQLESFDNPEDS